MTTTFRCPQCTQYKPLALRQAGLCVECYTDSADDELSIFRAQTEAKPKLPKPTASTTAQRILAERELCRRKLMPFVKKFNRGYKNGWVHDLICEELEQFSDAVIAEESPRLMIFMPPRHGKSELCSRIFPAWHLGRMPTHEVIASSYSGSLALKFSRRVRATLREVAFERIFPACKLDPDSQAAEAWTTTEEGGYMAAGVNGPVTGNGMHIGIIDDPVKNRVDAESETQRETTWDWYTSTFYTRRAPGAGILVIMTRWHDDDLAGRLLKAQKDGTGDEWRVLDFSAIAEEDDQYRKKGDALHPERYSAEALRATERVIGPRDWAALYQQHPVNDAGDYFSRGMFKYYEAVDRPPLSELSIYQTWDLAIGQKQANDWTVGVSIGVDRNDNIWVLEVVRGRWDGYEIVEKILDFYEAWPTPQMVGIERGQIELTIGPHLNKRIGERRLFAFNPIPLKPGRSDKPARARAIQGRMRQGMVFFPSEADWMKGLVDEMLRFPNGANDDQVDALAWVGQMLMQFSPQAMPTEIPKPGWKDKLSLFTGQGSARSSMGA